MLPFTGEPKRGVIYVYRLNDRLHYLAYTGKGKYRPVPITYKTVKGPRTHISIPVLTKPRRWPRGVHVKVQHEGQHRTKIDGRQVKLYESFLTYGDFVSDQ